MGKLFNHRSLAFLCGSSFSYAHSHPRRIPLQTLPFDSKQSDAQGKPHRPGRRTPRHHFDSLRAGLAGALTAFLHQPAKNLRRLTTFDDNQKSKISNPMTSSGLCATSPSKSTAAKSLATPRRTIPSIALRAGIGRNGAGKSTLLKILFPSQMTITHPTSGRVTTSAHSVQA